VTSSGAAILLIGLAALASTNPSAVSAQTTGAHSTSPVRGFADSLQMITDLLDRGRGIEAENVARALLVRIESSRGPDAIEVAEVLDLLYRAVCRSSKVKEEEKREIVERAVTIKERTLDPLDPDLATSLINLGLQRTLAGDPAGGKPPLERALAIREAVFGSDHPSIITPLTKLAGLRMTLHDDDGAKVLLERAQRLREMAYGANHPETIRTLVGLAILYQETGDYTAARQRYERALALCERIGGRPDLLLLHVLNAAAVVLSELGGDLAGSARLDERLLALTEQTYGPTDLRLRIPLEHLAMDRRDLGDYAAARALAERSLAIAERARGPKSVEAAESLHTLASILAELGDYAGAIQAFERATQTNEELLRPRDPETARASWFIRDLIPLSGYDPDQVDLFERVLACWERGDYGLGDPRAAERLSNLAAVLSTAEDFRRARPLFERALESQERFLGPDHPTVAAAATNLAYVLSRTGDYEAARRLYERALRNWETSLGPDHPRVATALVNLARLDLATGKYPAAGPLLDRALAVQEKALGPEHPDIAVTLTTRAELTARNGATTEAFATAARAEALSREHLRLTVRTLPERQALAYASSLPSSLDLMLRLGSTRPGDRQMATEAWNAVIRARGLVLDEMAARHRAVGAGEAKEIAKLAEALASARQHLAALAMRGIRNDAPERYRRLLQQARAEKDRTERALAVSSARFRDEQSRSRALLPDIFAALPPESALVGFVTFQRQGFQRADANTTATPDSEVSYLAFVLRADDPVPAVVPLGSATRIDEVVLQWRQQLDREAMAAGRETKRAEGAYRRVAGELRREIWDPLLSHLANPTRVFVVPDGALHLVSFAALPIGESRYLIETGPAIHYLSAERDLVPREAAQTTGRGLLAVGGPAFDDESGLAPGASETSFRGTRSACLDLQPMRVDPLPASLKEVNQVVTLWNAAHRVRAGADQLRSAMASARDAILLTGAGASESAFKTEAPGRRVLHLATHGFFLGGGCSPVRGSSGSPAPPSARIVRENPLLLSGLILAGANRRSVSASGEDDGVLTAEEVAALNLTGVEWAVLSGCDTGVGEVRVGEGVFGLRRAFQMAGAKTVIMSLWPVEDRATRQWMTTLYEGRLIKMLNTADAAREASLALLRKRRVEGFSTHPFYWAAFVAAGDWR
jgi:CHAT domain-containing protein/tetratricopeptide (TPR) repeat protein